MMKLYFISILLILINNCYCQNENEFNRFSISGGCITQHPLVFDLNQCVFACNSDGIYTKIIYNNNNDTYTSLTYTNSTCNGNSFGKSFKCETYGKDIHFKDNNITIQCYNSNYYPYDSISLNEFNQCSDTFTRNVSINNCTKICPDKSYYLYFISNDISINKYDIKLYTDSNCEISEENSISINCDNNDSPSLGDIKINGCNRTPNTDIPSSSSSSSSTSSDSSSTDGSSSSSLSSPIISTSIFLIITQSLLLNILI